MTGKVQQDELSIASGHHISPSPKPAIESLILWGEGQGRKGSGRGGGRGSGGGG